MAGNRKKTNQMHLRFHTSPAIFFLISLHLWKGGERGAETAGPWGAQGTHTAFRKLVWSPRGVLGGPFHMGVAGHCHL